MSTPAASEDGEIGFQIAPMVDVVFVLMLFFMACAGWQVAEKELSVNFPALPSGGPVLPPPVLITIDISPDGQVIANGQAFGTSADRALTTLRDWLKNTQSFGGQDPVLIRPNPATRHERIMDVLNACQAAGINKITFAS